MPKYLFIVPLIALFHFSAYAETLYVSWSSGANQESLVCNSQTCYEKGIESFSSTPAGVSYYGNLQAQCGSKTLGFPGYSTPYRLGGYGNALVWGCSTIGVNSIRLTDINPNASYAHNGQCTITTTLSIGIGNGWYSVDEARSTSMTQNGATRVSAYGQVAFERNSSNCLQDLLEFGGSWGRIISTMRSTMWTMPYYRNHNWPIENPNPWNGIRACVAVNGQQLACNTATEQPGEPIPEPPKPVVCTFDVPKALDHGILGKNVVSGDIQTGVINYSCTANASVILWIQGGVNGTNSKGRKISLGNSIDTTICFANGDNCVDTNGKYTFQGTSGDIGIKSMLSANNPSGNDYEASVVIITQQN
ncbi:hypothetical protein [Providencia vermicola]|uniref:hypothetical protein n=1 Tax=Providencia vermicola TaxID=333965 RepID=UPI0034D75CA4